MILAWVLLFIMYLMVFVFNTHKKHKKVIYCINTREGATYIVTAYRPIKGQVIVKVTPLEIYNGPQTKLKELTKRSKFYKAICKALEMYFGGEFYEQQREPNASH